MRARAQLAVVPQRSNLDRAISIRRNLTFHAAYHGVPSAEAAARADELLEQFGLRERGDVKPDLFSGGQAQRVMIARALMHAAAGAVPRRADHRPRPGGAAVRLGPAARAAARAASR